MSAQMRGASASSLADVLAAVDAASGSGATGDDLFAVVGVLDATPTLRRVLTDPSTEADAKAGLATRVLEGKVGADALAVVQTAVRGRWSAGRDLADALETAGVAAHVAAADAAGDLDRLEDELFTVGQAVEGDPELRRVVTDRSITAADKAPLVDRLLDGRATATTVSLVKQAVAARTGSFEKALDAISTTVAERRQRLLGEVRVAAPLGDGERERLAQALSRKYGRTVHLNVVVDPTVVGGIAVSIGDDVIDGTISGRLEDARRRLAG